MQIQQAILTAMEDVLGIPQSELRRRTDVDLVDTGLMDSLSVVAILDEICECIGRHICFESLSIEHFRNIHSLEAALRVQIA